LTMPVLSATMVKQSKRPAMNYLALGNDVYFFREGALHCRSNGVTEQLNWQNLSENEIEFFANLAYYLEQIENLTREYTEEVFTK
jgi:hypothetical protein